MFYDQLSFLVGPMTPIMTVTNFKWNSDVKSALDTEASFIRTQTDHEDSELHARKFVSHFSQFGQKKEAKVSGRQEKIIINNKLEVHLEAINKALITENTEEKKSDYPFLNYLEEVISGIFAVKKPKCEQMLLTIANSICGGTEVSIIQLING